MSGIRKHDRDLMINWAGQAAGRWPSRRYQWQAVGRYARIADDQDGLAREVQSALADHPGVVRRCAEAVAAETWPAKAVKVCWRLDNGALSSCPGGSAPQERAGR